jgi:hypothetical protein
VLQAEFAAAAQSCSDVAEKSLQLKDLTYRQDPQQSLNTHFDGKRSSLAAQGQRHRQRLASWARAAACSDGANWQPQLGGLLQQAYDTACTKSKSESVQGKTFGAAATAIDAVSESLHAAAARSESNERYIQGVVNSVEEVIDKHTIADAEAANAAVEGIARFLEFAHTAHRRPNESSIKQLVCTSNAKDVHSSICLLAVW